MTASGDHVYQIFKRRSITRPHRAPILDGRLGRSPADSEVSSQLAADSEVSSQLAVLASASEVPPETARPAPEPLIQATSLTPDAPTHEVVALERTLIEILARDPEPRETIDAAFRRKEQQLGEVFAALTPADARAVLERLEAGRVADALAKHFSRLAVDRRQRLLAFLADTPRRVELTRKSRS